VSIYSKKLLTAEYQGVKMIRKNNYFGIMKRYEFVLLWKGI